MACVWNVTQQAFTGAACVTAPVTRMATLHTTDFAVGPAPRIMVASPSDLVAVGPSMLRKLRLLITILVCLFAGMHLLARLLSLRDSADVAHVLESVRSRDLGCTTVDGLHTWRLTQAPLSSVVDHVQGSAVEFAALLGLPYDRLSLAIPEHLFGGAAPKHATGRAHGISAAALRKHHGALLHAIKGGLKVDTQAKTEGSKEGSAEAEQAAQPDLLQMSSTALVHAFLVSWCLWSTSATREQQNRYIELLTASGVDPGGHTFLKLYLIYKELLMGHCASALNWLPKARVLRAVLLRESDGCWEPCDAVACCLLASSHAAASEPAHGFQLVRDFVQSVVSSVTFGGADGDAEDIAAAFYDQKRRDAGRAGRKVPTTDLDSQAEEEDLDDPLHHSAAAITDSIPSELLAHAAGDTAQAGRLWATACIMAFLRTQRATWMTSAHDAELPRSIVDDAASALAKQLPDEEMRLLVVRLARAQVAWWAANNDRLVTRSRAAYVTSAVYATSEAQRLLCSIANSLIARSPTVSMFAATYSVGCRRWMNAILLITSLLAMLMVQIWLFWCACMPVEVLSPLSRALACGGLQEQSCGVLR